MGSRFSDYSLPALANPMGTLYNPTSIQAVIREAVADSSPTLPLTQTNGQWHCWLAGTQLSAATEADCRQRVGEALQQLREHLSHSSHLFLTLGTNVCYRLHPSGMIVANCHKAPSASFEECRLSKEECTEALSDVVRSASALNPGIEVVFTVSPYRYQKYGFHGSQLAKATLLLAIDEVCGRFPEYCTYLPVYELFMDELRDYRFYAPDMIHPSEVAVNVVWQRLVGECMDERLQRFINEYEPIRRALAHRPQDPHSETYQNFLKETEKRRATLLARYQNDTL